MLKHEEPVLDAAQERVGADELARAIAAIEGRRQDKAQRMQGTLSIGEAVRELDLDATPDEVWAEVRAQRVRAQTPPPAAPVPPAPAPPPLPQSLGNALRDAALAAAPGLKQAAQAAAPSLKQGMEAVSRSLNAQKPTPVRRFYSPVKQSIGAFAVVCAMVGVLAGAGVLSHLPFTHPAPVASWRALSSVPDGHAVIADTNTVLQIQKGNTNVPVRDIESSANTWTLVRHDKHWYVRGYVREDTEIGAGAVKMYTDNNAGVLRGVREKDVTLRLDTLKVDDTNDGDNWQELDVSNVHPDAYTREDW